MQVVRAADALEVSVDAVFPRLFVEKVLPERGEYRLAASRRLRHVERGKCAAVQRLGLAEVRLVVFAGDRVPFVLAMRDDSDPVVERTHGKREVVQVERHPDRRSAALRDHDVERRKRRLGVVEQRPVPVPEYVKSTQCRNPFIRFPFTSRMA